MPRPLLKSIARLTGAAGNMGRRLMFLIQRSGNKFTPSIISLFLFVYYQNMSERLVEKFHDKKALKSQDASPGFFIPTIT
jgi:hypothetical protein